MTPEFADELREFKRLVVAETERLAKIVVEHISEKEEARRVEEESNTNHGKFDVE